MLKRIYTRALTEALAQNTCFPVNPFKFIQRQLEAISVAWMLNLQPELDYFFRIFSSQFQLGICIASSHMADGNTVVSAGVFLKDSVQFQLRESQDGVSVLETDAYTQQADSTTPPPDNALHLIASS